MRFYTTHQLGEKQSLTPEGFLLCQDVPVARTGVQLYAEGEVPIDAGPDKIIRIERDPEEVFDPRSIASYPGKPIVDEHPTEDGMGIKITPDTWKKFSKGVVLNPRRGDGVQFDNDFLYADFLIQDPEAIAAVRDGKREVSVGYDADYEQIAPGHGRQKDIICNHIALVEKGRCGTRCAIGDQAMSNRLNQFMGRFRKAVRTRDEAGALNLVSELEKDPELLGEVVSDAEGLLETHGGDDKHHVTVNLHMPKGAEMGERRARDAEPGGMEAEPESRGAAGGGGGGDPLSQIMQRLDAIEQTLVMLAQAEEDEGGEGEEEPGEIGEGEDAYDRRTVRDRRGRARDARGRGRDAEPGGNEKRWPQGEPGEEEEGGTKDVETGFGVEIPNLPKGEKGTGDRRRAAVGDSSSMKMAFTDMLSRAEILTNGQMSYPTFDAALPARATFDAMCSFRRQALSKAWKDNPPAKEVIGPLLEQSGKRADFHDAKLTCDSVAMIFGSASQVMRERNAFVASTRQGANGGNNLGSTKAATPADINAKNAAFYARA